MKKRKRQSYKKNKREAAVREMPMWEDNMQETLSERVSVQEDPDADDMADLLEADENTENSETDPGLEMAEAAVDCTANGAEETERREMEEEAETEEAEEDVEAEDLEEDVEAEDLEEDVTSEDLEEDVTSEDLEEDLAAKDTEESANKEGEEGQAAKEDPMEEETAQAKAAKKLERKQKKKDHMNRMKGWRILHLSKLVYFFALLVAALCIFGFVYLHSRKEPIEVTKKYLASMQTLDFNTMKSLLQSEDLTALEDADLANDIYRDFFQNINSKLAFQIKKTAFDLGSGTARVTAHLRYIDGTEIYRAAVGSFLMEVVNSAFSGDSLTQTDTQEKLASLLQETEGQFEEQYAETEISYPLVRTDYGWKISSLDDQTVKVMSANHVSIENEILQALEQANTLPEEPEEGDEEETTLRPAEPASLLSFDPDETLLLETDTFRVEYESFVVDKDYAGKDCILFYYTYTNLSKEVSSPMLDVNLAAFQSGETLSPAVPNRHESAIDHYFDSISPGETSQVCQAFLLQDGSNVSIQASAAATLGAQDVDSQILRLE